MNVLVTGSTGFVGTNLMDYLEDKLPVDATLFHPQRRYELLHDHDTMRMFHDSQPDVVVHLAASVGGIGANMASPVDFFTENMVMGMNVMRACHAYHSYCILIGTVCSYPAYCQVPFKEHDIWNGKPEETNSSYGIAKRSLIQLLKAYNQQYGMQGTVLIPTNMYGKHDNFDPDTSHVIPALIRKFHHGGSEVEVWGTGNASREFLHVDDFCDAILLAIQKRPSYINPINISGGNEIVMAGLVDIIAEITGFDGQIVFDHNKPDGQPRRKVDGMVARHVLGYQPQRDLIDGIQEVYDWYKTTI